MIEDLPFGDGTFDVVLSSLMFHHLPPDLKGRGLAEILRVLKPGGRLIVVDMKTPEKLTERLAVTALLHHGMIADVRQLVPLMDRLGYVKTQAGSLTWSVLGFVQGSRAC
ncbi:MAG: class I SAM-dependent methyltransferase [Chloroflexi bacterium]|nr:class I SAM-dependent methyltransferase [Chloroflexota bacterium]